MNKKLRDSKKKTAYQMRTHLIHGDVDNTRWDYVSALWDVAVLVVFCNGARRVRRETVKTINAATSPISPPLASEHLATVSRIDRLILANPQGFAHDRREFAVGLFCRICQVCRFALGQITRVRRLTTSGKDYPF
jgi:hypothetical protein